MERYKFPKQEKVVSKYDIDMLFGKARSVREGNLLFRFVWRLQQENEPNIRVLMVVPKKRVKLAVKRNRIKRQLKEVYRLNKLKLNPETDNKTLLVAIMYQSSEMPKYQELESNFKRGLKALKTKIDKA